jgi:hypothetical protein
MLMRQTLFRANQTKWLEKFTDFHTVKPGKVANNYRISNDAGLPTVKQKTIANSTQF